MTTLLSLRTVFFVLGGGMIVIHMIMRRRGRENRLLLLVGTSLLLFFIYLSLAQLVLSWRVPGPPVPPFPALSLPQ